MIFGLFATPIGRHDIERELTEKEISFVKNLETTKNEGNVNSVNTYILNEPELKDINEFLETKVKEYFLETYIPKDDFDLAITQSWSNVTKKDEYHHKHSHANSLISGVFYVQADENKDKIHFFKEQINTLDVYSENFNEWNAQSWWFPVKTGQLFLFPSRLHHMVERLDHDQERISIAFNTFPYGLLGRKESLTQLKVNR